MKILNKIQPMLIGENFFFVGVPSALGALASGFMVVSVWGYVPEWTVIVLACLIPPIAVFTWWVLVVFPMAVVFATTADFVRWLCE